MIENFQDFTDGQTYTVYFKFDDSYSSVSGVFNGFVYLNEDGVCVRQDDVSEEEVMCNGPEGVWLDDEAFLFDDISYIEVAKSAFEKEIESQTDKLLDMMEQISAIVNRS